MAGGISVPRPGIESVPPAVEAWTTNHWTTREFPRIEFWKDPSGCAGGPAVPQDSRWLGLGGYVKEEWRGSIPEI